VETDNIVEAKDHIISSDRCVTSVPDVPDGQGGESIRTAMIVRITEGGKIKAAKAVLDSLTATAFNRPRSRWEVHILGVRRRRIDLPIP
jgi:hypothetical protein